MSVETVWIVRPGFQLQDERGEVLPDREFPEDSPVPLLPVNKGLARRVTREADPAEEPVEVEPLRFRQPEDLWPEADFGEDAED